MRTCMKCKKEVEVVYGFFDYCEACQTEKVAEYQKANHKCGSNVCGGVHPIDTEEKKRVRYRIFQTFKDRCRTKKKDCAGIEKAHSGTTGNGEAQC